MALLADLFSKATGSLPTFKISKWDVMVLKGQAPKRKTDKGIKGLIQKAIRSAEDFVSNIQDAVSGIFQGSINKYETIARFDSFVSFNGSRESQIMQNAIENGSFRSVNKIRKPNTCVVELAKGGYRSEVEACLEAIKKVNGSLLTCRIVTPFGYMDNMNMIKLDYSYTRDNGANLLIVKMTFQEIRYGSVKESETKFITENVKNPGDTNTASTGTLAAKGRWER
ncbi:MAG: hypothetical protein J6S85_02855 [Methanobrevibacter sp.]|nr:hypothetical protein [Methanobrevibacter sp.]